MLETLLNKYGNQAKIAEAIGVTPMAVSKWYAGTTAPSRRNLERISKELGMPLGEVYEKWEVTKKEA